MVAIEPLADTTATKGRESRVFHALRAHPPMTRKGMQRLAAWYGASALQRHQTKQKLPDVDEMFTGTDRQLHMYAHARGFCEGVDLAIRMLHGEDAYETFRDTYLKDEWRAAAGLPPKEYDE